MGGPLLTLGTDTPITAPTLAAYLSDWAGQDAGRIALADLIKGMAVGSIPLARRLGQGRLSGNPNAVVGHNATGDKQKALDMAAHHHFLAELGALSVAKVLSEEADAVIDLSPSGRFDVALDPVDGSGSIGIGAPLGMLFCAFPAGDSFLRSGRDIIAAGYASFGHTVDFGFSLGEGVVLATLDPQSGVFHIDTNAARVANTTATIAFNASNQRHWPLGLRTYVDDLLAGKDGPRRRNFNMRWIAAAVGDLHRILHQGGVFMYPADARKGYEDGFLRLPYEAFPIAYLMEQAGGAATDGRGPILDLTPGTIHARTPLFFGAAEELATLHGYLSNSDT